MKIIKEGSIPPLPKPIWIGLVIECPYCKTQFELEEGDNVNLIQSRASGSGGRINYYKEKEYAKFQETIASSLHLAHEIGYFKALDDIIAKEDKEKIYEITNTKTLS